MPYALLADLTLVLHLAFIIFVVAGALLALRRPVFLWPQVVAVCWGAWIEFSAGICPLTPLENHFRALAGDRGYSGDFIGHYLLPIVYPAGLTPTVQTMLGALVVVVNVAAYGTALLHRWR